MRFRILTLLLMWAACPPPGMVFAQSGSAMRKSTQAAPSVPGQPAPASSALFDLKHVEHIYIPESQLSTVFKQDQVAAVMSLAEFTELVTQARAAADRMFSEQLPPALTSAHWQMRIADEQLLADVEIQITTTRPQAETDLNVAGWNVMSAKLDDETAIITRTGENLNTLRLFVPAPVRHVLKLQLATPLKHVGNDQLASVGLPVTATGELVVSLPAGKFLHVNRVDPGRPNASDQPAEYRLPAGGMSQLELRITDRQQASRLDLLTFASTAYGVRVQPSEITWSAQTELQVFGQSIDRLVCRVPHSLEITKVESAGLESWELADEPDHPGRVTITLKYRQPFDGNRTVQLQGILSESPDQPWQVPDLTIAQVTSHTGRIIIGHPANVRLQELESQGVRALQIPIATAAKKNSLGAEQLFYSVWQEGFTLKFAATLKEQQLQAAMTSLLLAEEAGLNLVVTLSLQTRQTPLFDARIRIPADYHVLSAARDGIASKWDVVPLDAGINEIRLPLNPPLLPGQSTLLALQTQALPEEWPVRQTPLVVAIPEVRLPQADMVEALYGISAPNDLELVPQELTGLDPATQSDLDLLNSRLREMGRQVRLGFTYQDTVFQGQLQISRQPTLFTAQTLISFRVDRETVSTHLESQLSLTGGGIRELTVLSSEAAGDKIRFSIAPRKEGSSSAQLVEQIPGEVTNGLRTWKLTFDRYLQGEYLFSTHVQLPRAAATMFSPARMQFPQTSVQSGYVAIEGPPDEQVRVTAQSADGQPLPMVDPVDLPSSSGHSKERIVAGYRFVRPDWNINVTTTQFNREAISSAIVHDAKLASVWGPGSALQHQASYTFTAYGMQSLIVMLPTDSTLWSTLLDGQAIEARKGGEGARISLVGLKPQASHTLEVIYETPAIPAQPRGELRAEPPVLSVISGSGEAQPLSILKQQWDLHYPKEILLTGSTGQFRPDHFFWNDIFFTRLLEKTKLPDMARLVGSATVLLLIFIGLTILWYLIRWANNDPGGLVVTTLLTVLGLFLLISLLLPAVQQSREAARRSQIRQLERSILWSEPEAVPTPMKPADKPLSEQAEMSRIQDDLRKSNRSSPDMDMPIAKDTLPTAAKPAPAGKSGNAPASSPAMGDELGAMGGNPTILGAELKQEKPEFSTGGLLSMSFGLQIPDDTYVRQFHYDGNAADARSMDLHVQFAHRTTSRVLLAVIALGVALLGWWLRWAAIPVRLFYLFLTLVLPIALLGVLPMVWVILSQGVLLGGLAALCSWGLVRCECSCLTDCCSLVRWRNRESRSRALGLLALITLGGTCAHADDAPGPPDQPNATPAHVIVPYQSLQEIAQADRVYVPAALFRQLWKAAHPEDLPPASATVPFTLAEGNIGAKLIPEGDQYTLRMQFRWVVMNLTDHAQVIPLSIKTPGLTDPRIDGEPAALIPLENGMLGVVVPTRGTHVIDATLLPSQKFKLTEGKFKISSLPVPAGVLTFEIPSTQETLSLRVNDAAGRARKEPADGVTRFQIPIDQGGDFTIQWQETSTSGAIEDNLQLETAVLAHVEDAGVALLHNYDLKVRQGTVNDISFDVPAGMALRRISGAEISGWESAVEDGQKRLKVVFTRPVTNQTSFRIELFQSHQLIEMTEPISIRTLAPQGVTHEAGQLAVAAPDHLRLRATEAKSLQQIDVSQFQRSFAPRQHEPADIQLAYRFFERPFTLQLEASRRDAEARSIVDHGVQISRRKTIIASRIALELAGAPQRMIEVQLPAGYLTMDMVCAQAADWYVVTQGELQRLVIELDQPRTGTIEIGLEGHLTRNPQDETLTVDLPRPLNISRSTQRLGVWCDEMYQAALVQAGNWRSIASQELPAPIRKLRPQPPLFGFQTTGEPAPLQFQLQRAIPEIQGDAGLLIAVGDATLDYGLTLRWKITRAAADQFAFTAPDWLGHLDFTGPGIRQIRSEPADAGRTRWIVSLIDPVRGQYLITAAATIATPENLTVQTPRLEFESPTDVGGYLSLPIQRQFAVLVNLSQNQLIPADPEQFESVAVDQLPLSMPSELVQQAMEIVRVRHDKIPAWSMQRMQRAAGSQAIISSCALTTILQMDGSWRTQATFGVRNRGQQFLALKLPAAAQILSIFVREEPGRAVVTSLGEETIHLIALPQTSAADLSFDVSLILSGQLSQALPQQFRWARQQIQLPAVQVVTPKESAEFGVTVAQTVWNVFVPEEVDAVPIGKTGVTNVNFHRGSGWLTAQTQLLDRIRGDIAEMKRIATSSENFSISQRRQAQHNLKQLQSQLRSQQHLSDYGSSTGADDSKLKSYLSETGKVISEADQAVRELESLEFAPQSQTTSSEARSTGNRGYIMSNNQILSDTNSLRESSEKTPTSGSTFNFFERDDQQRYVPPRGKLTQEQDARMQLRQQLQSQSFAPQQGPGESPAVNMGTNLGLGSRQMPMGWRSEANPGFSYSNANSPSSIRPFGSVDPVFEGSIVPWAPGIDRPFRQGSFDLAAPTFGGLDPNAALAAGSPSQPRAAGRAGQSRDNSGPEVDSVVEQDVPQAPVTSPMGLSVAMTLPQAGQELSFDKPGGNPLLTLAVRSKRTGSLLIGGLWGVGTLCLGVWLLGIFQQQESREKSMRAVCLLMMLIGGAAFLLLPEMLSIAGLVLFCLAGLMRVILLAPNQRSR